MTWPVGAAHAASGGFALCLGLGTLIGLPRAMMGDYALYLAMVPGAWVVGLILHIALAWLVYTGLLCRLVAVRWRALPHRRILGGLTGSAAVFGVGGWLSFGHPGDWALLAASALAIAVFWALGVYFWVARIGALPRR